MYTFCLYMLILCVPIVYTWCVYIFCLHILCSNYGYGDEDIFGVFSKCHYVFNYHVREVVHFGCHCHLKRIICIIDERMESLCLSKCEMLFEEERCLFKLKTLTALLIVDEKNTANTSMKIQKKVER